MADDVERVHEHMESDDAAGVLLRYEDGLRGACTVSQVSAGRKNTVEWEVDGSVAALAWASEDPERLWMGHRGRPNEIIEKDAALMTSAGIDAAGYPAGHVEGYPDTFRGVVRRRLPRRRRRRAVGAPVVPDVRRRSRRRCWSGDAVASSARSGIVDQGRTELKGDSA